MIDKKSLAEADDHAGFTRFHIHWSIKTIAIIAILLAVATTY